MHNNNKTSSLTEAAMVCGILVIMSMVSYYILPFIDFLFPLPAIILGKRRGCKYSALSLVASSLIIMMILGLPVGLFSLCMYAPIGIVMSYFIAKDKSPSKAIIFGAIAMLISLIIILYAIDITSGVDISGQIETMFKESLELQKTIMNATGMPQEQQSLIIDMYENITDYVILLLPAALMTFSLLLAVANYFVTQKFALRFKVEIKPLRDFAFFALPRNFILGIGFLIILSYFLEMMKFNNMDIILINILTIGRYALIVHGLALTKFYMIISKIGGFFRLLAFIFILFVPILSNIITIIALLDLIINFRKLTMKKKLK